MNESLKATLFIVIFVVFALYLAIIRGRTIIQLRKKYGTIFSDGKLSDEDKELLRSIRLKTFVAFLVLISSFIMLLFLTK